MQSTISAGGQISSATDRSTLAGSILFVGLVVAILLAISYPGIAAAAALGAISAHLAHRIVRYTQRTGRR